MGTPSEQVCILVIISRLTLLKMRNVSDKICRENQKTYFAFNNVEKYGKTRSTPKATNTHSECTILLALQWQQWLSQRAAKLTLIRTLPLFFDLVESWNSLKAGNFLIS
jgi:hypothetical protein